MLISRNQLWKSSALICLAWGTVGFASSPLLAVESPPGFTKLFEVEGRAGAPGGMDYEFAIGPFGADSNNTGQIYRDWTNGEIIPFLLNWDGTSAIFSIGSESISFMPDVPVDFTAWSILTKATTKTGKVDPGTRMEFLLRRARINDNPSSILLGRNNNTFSSSIAPAMDGAQDLNEIFFTAPPSVTNINAVSGLIRMSWGGGDLNPNQAAARSHVSFEFAGYGETPTTALRVSRPSSQVVAVPEPQPISLLGLITFGIIGTYSTLKRSHISKK